jgi:serine/threonine protein kinase
VVDVVHAWLHSGDYAVLNNIALVPRSDGAEAGWPMLMESDEGVLYFLVGQDDRGWILKKFLPGLMPELAYVDAIQKLIPKDPGFESGFERTMLRGTNVSRNGFHHPEFRKWIEGTILMPEVAARTWADVARSVQAGSITLSDFDRILLYSRLSSLIVALESQGLAHRDLSSRNILVDTMTRNVHLVDWDSLYHASLRMQAETTCGTRGYMAPFVKVDGEEDVHLSWQEKSDRFSLAVLNCELLVMATGSISVEEGGLLRQSDIDKRSGRTVLELRKALKIRFPAVIDLFNQAISARTFEKCPSPGDWLKSAQAILDIMDAGTEAHMAFDPTFRTRS